MKLVNRKFSDVLTMTMLMTLMLIIGITRPALANDAEAFLDIQLRDGLLIVIPWVKAPKPGSYRYVLRSRVLEPYGGSSASTSGQLVLPARLVRLNARARHRVHGPDQRIKFSLHLFRGAELVAEDTVSFPD